jgi:hypothetical protein
MEIGRIYKTTAFLCLTFRQEESASAFGACRLQAQFHSLTYRYHPTRAGAIEWLRSSTKSQAGGFHDPKKQSGTFLECRQVADLGPGEASRDQQQRAETAGGRENGRRAASKQGGTRAFRS